MTDFIEEMQAEAELRFGRELTPQEVAKKFAEHDFEARIHHLKHLRKDDEFPTPREAVKRSQYLRALKSTHEHLRAINR
jgi:hypothetical protein